MTTTEALNKVDAALLSLGLFDEDGPLLSAEVAGTIGLTFGPEWSDWEDRLEAKKITAAEYARGICQLVDAFRKKRFHQQIATRLEDLHQRQKEMGIA